MQSTNTLLQSVSLDNLGTNKLQESADDKKTWKQKTDEVLHGRRALDSVFRIIIIIKDKANVVRYYSESISYCWLPGYHEVSRSRTQPAETISKPLEPLKE